MKHYMDITRIKEDSESELTVVNTRAFEVGDHIIIQEKIDGANASFRLDDGENLLAFSRKNELDYQNTLRGFWNYVQSLDKEKFKDLENRVVFGEWLCLSGDTIIRKTSGGKNKNYMTLREMYKFYTEPTLDKYHYNPYKGNHSIITYLIEKNKQTFDELLEIYKKHSTVTKWTHESSLKRIISYNIKRGYITVQDNIYSITSKGIEEYYDFIIRNNWWHRYGMPSIFSLYHDENILKPNQILNIVYTGDKKVYEVKTRLGYSIKTTLDHRFFTPYGYVSLKSLKVNDCVAVTPFKNNKGTRRLGKGSRMIKELQDQYKKKIGKCEVCGSKNCLELHHKDGNYLNNTEDNWEVLCADCHINKHKSDDKFKGFEYEYYFDNIIEINYIGVEDCYDIEMSGDENCANFVANHFIVHNCKHTVKYNTDAYNNFYVFDMYDTETEQWLSQDIVKEYAETHGLNYIHTLYDGEFVSWEHCKSFLHSPAYGDNQEGIIIKNESKLNNPDVRNPFYLKIVNDSFKETKAHNHIKKVLDPQHQEEKSQAEEIANEVVTKARVQKEIHKMIDEGILPEKLQPKDMSVVARNLPKRIYDDIVKEELERISDTIGNQYFGKAVNAVTMNYAKDIVLK